jgi:sulfite reductase (NADPH) flavoprotein alpha-component
MSSTQGPSDYSRNRPFRATLIERRALNRPGSDKDTRHLVLDLSGSGIKYRCGDALGLHPSNHPEVVEAFLQLACLDGDAVVTSTTGASRSLRDELSHGVTLNRAGKKWVKALAQKLAGQSVAEPLNEVIADEAKLEEFVHSRDYVDVLREFPGAPFTPQEIVGLINRIQPRLYSIASGPTSFPDQVHLTVALLEYSSHGRRKTGLASGYLAEGVSVGSSVPVYIQPTRHFHLPEDNSRDVIMVGPGTGIAPFRAFLQERQAIGATGRNWLFFGDQHRATDYLYEDELEEWHRQGFLTRRDLAFSRDQAQKVYVQHRMLEQGATLWDWLQNGAYFYVCGDAKRMARDVHETLIKVAETFGQLSREAASNYVDVVLAQTEKRYLKDVY